MIRWRGTISRRSSAASHDSGRTIFGGLRTENGRFNVKRNILLPLVETVRVLDGQASPAMRCLAVVGSNERIVDVPRIHDRMERWPQGRLMVIEGGEHEVLMEGPQSRARILEGLDATFT